MGLFWFQDRSQEILDAIAKLQRKVDKMSDDTAAVKATLEHIRADVEGLTAASARLTEQVNDLFGTVESLNAQVAELTAGQDAAVEAAVASMRAALDEVNTQVADIRTTAEQIDAMTPDAPPAG